MNRSTRTQIDTTDVQDIDGLRRVLLGAAKLRWGWSVGIGYSAVFVAPIALLFDSERWAVLALAAIVSFVAVALRLWSEAIRDDTDRIHRAYDILMGLGQPPDPAMIEGIKSRHSREADKVKVLDRPKYPYFDATGKPSANLLVENLRQSAWYTSQLAAAAKRKVNMAAIAASVVPFSFILSDSMLMRAYGITICLVVLIDIFQLGSKYGRLSIACNEAFLELRVLRKRGELAERDALLAATNYHFVRRMGPLIPEWLWWKQRENLNAGWESLLKGERRGQR